MVILAQGNGFGPGGPMTPQHVGNQSGCQSLEAQRQQYAAQLGQRALLTQQGGGGSAFPQVLPRLLLASRVAFSVTEIADNALATGSAATAYISCSVKPVHVRVRLQCSSESEPPHNAASGLHRLSSKNPFRLQCIIRDQQ